jgi:hypothetical protein
MAMLILQKIEGLRKAGLLKKVGQTVREDRLQPVMFRDD